MSSRYFFTRKGVQFAILVTVQNTHWQGQSALIHRQQTIHRIFKQTKLSSIYRHKLIGP